MKVEDLKVGEIYRCVLSRSKVLIVKAYAPKKTEDEEPLLVNSGKVCVMVEGIPSYSLIELHDGQLEEIKK